MVNNKLVIAIDFDGTIVNHVFPAIGELKPLAKDMINKLYSEGHYIIIWTCRVGKELAECRHFLRFSGIKYHRINENFACVFGCFPKVYADIYIDDRNLFHIDDWKKTYDFIQIKYEKLLRG